MGEGTDAARTQVLTARGLAAEEIDRLEASARAAVDVKAKVRRNPVKTAGLAAGAGFLVLGGPRRLLRGTRNAIFGKPDPLPKSMLPKQIDKAVRELGNDGARVRGTIEREFARYLEERAPERRKRDLSGVVALMLTTVAKPVVDRYGRQLVEQLLNPDAATFTEQLERVKARRVASPASAGASAGRGEPVPAVPTDPVVPRSGAAGR